MSVNRRDVAERYVAGRRRSRSIFELPDPEVYYTRPIPLRNPICFYEGHLPAFAVNTLLKKGLGAPAINERLERLFARGIDPEDEAAAWSGVNQWPSRDEIQAYAGEADRAVIEAFEHARLERDDRPALVRAEAVFAVLEHEPMHQETLLYMFHRLPLDRKRRPATANPITEGSPPARRRVRVPAGDATLGAVPDLQPFWWDNEFPPQVVHVPEFEIDVHDVTNADHLEFVDAGGYEKPEFWTADAWRWRIAEQLTHPLFWERHEGRWMWRGMFDLVDLPPAWPVYVSQAEAAAYARWKGLRLPTEAEFHRAAYGTPSGDERLYPWGDEPPESRHGNFGFQQWDPVPVGSCPGGRSAWGIHDLVGNGWEWTSTPFDGFPGFRPMASYPEYSADFFDGQHYVIKGASPATDAGLLRRSLRNWFRHNYPYVYATFRCVAS